jgi:diguanylate cyclase (GGDEF)-like protein
MENQLFIRVNDRLKMLGRSRTAFIILLFLIIIGALDYWVGYEISMSFFYLFPLGLASWYLDRRAGILAALLSVAIWEGAELANGRAFTSEWIRFWNIGIRLLSYLSFALLINELKRAVESAQALARTDHLTGIMNNREFQRQLETELKQAKRLLHPVTLVYIDLDNFKQVNDTLGHDAGDMQLRLVAQSIQNTVRATDLFGRLGGDEFALFLPNTDHRNAALVIEKIVQQMLIKLEQMHSPITLSLGVITCSSQTITPTELIQKADTLMYQAKLTGKNQAFYLEIK